jgi:hypothetical protein
MNVKKYAEHEGRKENATGNKNEKEEVDKSHTQ